jgi:hypothetical protein
MRRIRRFASLSLGDQARVAIATALLVTLPTLITVGSFSRVRVSLLWVAGGTEDLVSEAPRPERIAQLVKICDRRLPGERTCLVRSMTVETLLRVYGYSATHRIGVDKDDRAELEAHSWVEYEGEVLIGELDDLSRFTPFPDID